MSSTAVLVLVLLFVAYGVFAIPVMFHFRTYCRRVAHATDRIGEFNDQRSTDDGGNNAFEREQWWSLLSRDFKGLADPGLVAEAENLSRKVRISLLLAVCLVVAFPFVAGLR